MAGVGPVVPAIFCDDETVDLGGTARAVDYLMDAGVDGSVGRSCTAPPGVFTCRGSYAVLRRRALTIS